MKSAKYNVWRLSKYRFPTFEVHGMNGPGTGSLVIGRTKAASELSRALGTSRVDAMIQTDTAHEWVFKELKAA